MANIRLLLKAQSTFKVIFVLLFAIGCEFGLFLLFNDAFKFLGRMGGIGVMIIDRLFALFFLGMGAMLVVSSIVTAYGTVFRSEEIPFLVSRPFSMSQITVYKFVETTLLSTWAFSFTVVPFIAAYAWHGKSTMMLPLWTFVFSFPFLFVCSGIGTVITLLFVRWAPRGKIVRWLAILLAIVAAGFIVHYTRQARSIVAEGGQFSLPRLIPGLTLAANPLFPSWWLSEGVLALARGEWFRGAMLTMTLTSSALLMLVIVEWVGRLIFYESWLAASGDRNCGTRSAILLPSLDSWLAFLPIHIRGLIVKDVRTFLRDPMQWSQTLIFFGLLAIYFANLRQLRYHGLAPEWRNMVAFLNVFSVSAVMCSLASRFTYPQLSLEGHGFWIIGLSPVTMRNVMVTKFLMAVTGMLIVSVALMALSTSMLGASLLTRMVAIAVACAMSFAICALSVGLGAVFLDHNQRNPAAIVSGFGGTLNLVFGLVFMLAAIVPFALVFHMHTIRKMDAIAFRNGLLLSCFWLILITAAATVIPLWLGSRSLARREF